MKNVEQIETGTVNYNGDRIDDLPLSYIVLSKMFGVLLVEHDDFYTNRGSPATVAISVIIENVSNKTIDHQIQS